jgi:hypothetical protein
MTRKKKQIEEVQSSKESRYVPRPTIPEEPPVPADQCENCKSKSSLKVFVIIEPEDDWLPPHRFDTFCTKKCAKEWNRPTDSDELPTKIVPYDRWPDRQELREKKEESNS